MIEHAAEAWRRENEEIRYRAYVTDVLQAIAENTAKPYGGRIMTGRWIDLREERRPKDTRSGDEVAADVMRRCGLQLAEPAPEGA